ncbi:MAG: asparagine synthase (glutamine-hydrolyzing) [Planctomycetota bacterium]
MCGIAGFFDPSGRINQTARLIESMLSCIRHRGPDDGGHWISDDRQVTLGHRRLSILDTSSSGRQPYISSSGRYALTFNGEIYNFRQIYKELGSPPLTSSSDTAVVAAALDRWGIAKSIERFNGMFAVAIYDNQQNKLTLVRDRFGKKPIYYGHHENVFGFASELKPLKKIAGLCESVCPVAVEELMKFGYIASPRSIFRNVKKLEAGHWLELDCRSNEIKPVMTRYWEPRLADANEVPDHESEFVYIIEKLLTDSVKLRMVADVPLGAFLSGGIDSSLVCALMSQVASKRIKTFTIGFQESDFDEAVYARKIAKHLDTDHHEKYLTGSDALALVERMPKIYTEPFADPSQLPTFLVSQFARQSVTVALSGDGGDELFGGYTRYANVARGWVQKSTLAGRSLTWGLNIGNRICPEWLSQYAVRSTRRKTGRLGGRKTFRRELERRNVHRFHDYYGLNNSAYSLADSLLDPSFQNSAEIQPTHWLPFGNHQVQMSTHDLHYYLPEDILTKVDRASMAVSLETRNPILDFRIVPLAMKGLEKFSRFHRPKWALTSILEKHIPRQYFERPKQGFAIPYDQWLKNEIKPLMIDLLSPDKIQRDGFFESRKIQTAWTEFVAGDSITWGAIFWRFLMFQSWHDSFLE